MSALLTISSMHFQIVHALQVDHPAEKYVTITDSRAIVTQHIAAVPKLLSKFSRCVAMPQEFEASTKKVFAIRGQCQGR
ncbi:hypothetical protein [Burkholderia aenigmatica]|uniref:hypothetical protein n=1 Tax=Burkholderia aenigmatica TaxID=2015348 RepID=UPI001584365D|nr:hypothetical protein [Burkholderia aenigmatica]